MRPTITRPRNAQARIEGCCPVRSLGLLHQSALVAREHHVGYPVTRTRTRTAPTVPLTRILDSAHKNGPAQCFCTCIGIDRYTDRRHEMATIVGSRPAKYVELGGGLPALAITVNAENARRVSCPESLTEVHSRHEVLTSVEAVGVQGCTTSRHLYWT